MDKPPRIFGRAREWDGLAAFATRPTAVTGGGASLGVVSGRRRQGKSFLLQAMAEAAGGMYFAATEATETESLRLFTEALARHTREFIDAPFRDWNGAIAHLFHSFRDRPSIVAIDEFPFLSKTSPALPSIIQRELGPGGSGRTSSARLVLCGSAMSVMGGLLAGQAPLRGRASLELVVQPFRHRESAEFWGITDPRLAVLVHAVVGGTPAYRSEFTQGDSPATVEEFDAWVVRTALNPQTPLFREARYLLAEESAIRDPALYHSVLAAIAGGNNTNGGIASFIGRKTDHITHPLNVLEDCALIAREPDLLRPGRVRFRIVEPLITFYEAIMRKRWAELEIHRAEQVWSTTRQTFLTQVVGPHFEALCRAFVLESGDTLFAEHPAEVGSGTVNDPENRAQIEIDVVALSAQQANNPRRILSLGEAKWGEVIGHHHLHRLARARDLLQPKGYDTEDTVLALYGGAGFTAELTAAAATDDRILLVDLNRLYS
ncbi:AAA+ ATPase superfamily predicted ATPase [Actinoplanes tereljensis]|uniref:ArsR family transcriptional regulator n=1 Tax=Paractinoplanes tereljensis TaxID=571912 RepID=A0A919NS27_9ACTN|nr:ATP-binding protein [Actinoplanes tereljensis]GIF23663.1 ArsR family transcriptional regulator [Actinoplanes tereljensis]